MSIIPERGKRPEYTVKAVPGEAINVFDPDDLGTDFSNETFVFEPKPALLSVETGIPAVDGGGNTDVLTGKPSEDCVNGNPICAEPVRRKLANVFVTWDARPVLGEDAPTIGVDLAERDCSHSSSFESEAEGAKTTEEIEDIHCGPFGLRARIAAAISSQCLTWELSLA